MEITVREFRKSPFCRQDKSILRLINEKTTRKELPAIRNLYSTLTEIASNQARENISIYLFDIAKISWLSERTVSKGLDHLKKLWIVFMKPQERWTDGKYKSKEIRLTDGQTTVGKLEESSEKDEIKINSQPSDNKENNIIYNNKYNIKNNIEYYDFVYDFIDQENTQVKYQLSKNENYIETQFLEIDKLEKDWFGIDAIKLVLKFIKQDEFRSKQILSISKLRKKNKEWIPYMVLMIDRIKSYKPQTKQF